MGSLNRLLESINQPIEVQGQSLSISASIGVSLYPEDDQDPDTLLRHADQAMYVAKQSGKNRYHLYSMQRMTSVHVRITNFYNRFVTVWHTANLSCITSPRSRCVHGVWSARKPYSAGITLNVDLLSPGEFLRDH